MNGLPTFPLFHWAQRAPVFVIHHHVWLPSARTREFTVFLEGGEQKRGLVRVQTLEEMGWDYLSQNALALERWQAHILREQGETVAALSELRAQVRQLETVIFLGSRLIPRLQQLQGEPVTSFPLPASAATPVRERLEQHLAQVSPSPPSLTSLGSVLPAAEGWGFVEGHLCCLVKETSPEARRERPRVTLPEASYALEMQRVPMAEVAAGFYSRLRDLLIQHAHQHLPQRAALTEEVQRACAPCQELLRTLKSDSQGHLFLYDRPPWWVFQWQGQWFVGLRVERYALEDERGHLYAFDGTVVSVRADPEGCDYIAEVLTPRYEHPFLPSDGRRLCMGDYYERGLHHALRRLAPEERLLQFLLDARQTLVGGWHQHNHLTPYHKLSAFTHRRISRERATAENLPVYPYHRR